MLIWCESVTRERVNVDKYFIFLITKRDLKKEVGQLGISKILLAWYQNGWSFQPLNSGVSDAKQSSPLLLM